MYLKRLEIQGFKSLADKIELQFNSGISVIVGPNGCGKSNISDAIRWVLGEQSAKSLRGAKMEDVIFAGSDKRKQVGMAEVSITFDNSTGVFPLDFSEVTVTRRVYRSGESEFLINKSPCRLKDIHELFMDTGMGREGYSIIGQGKIDEILSVRSEDRRLIIEEAAGIVKYKTRKQQAVRKLEDTQQNLVRINDIIRELEAQIGPLEEQSKKAQEYLTFKHELDDLEINLLINQIHEQKEKLQEVSSKEEELKRNFIEAETVLRNTESVVEEQKLQISKLDEELSGLQKTVYETGSLIEKKESGILVASEKIKGNEAQKTNLSEEIEELQEKVEREKTSHGGDEEKLSVLRQRIASQQEKQEKLEESLERAENVFQQDQQKIEDGKADIIDLLNEIAGVKNSITSGQADQNNLLRRLRQLDEQDKSQREEYEKTLGSAEEINKSVSGIIEEIENFKKHEEKLLSQKDAFDKEVERLRSDLGKLRQNLQHRASRLKALEELQNSYEGYYRGVKEVLKEGKTGKNCPGICGVVAELIRVPEKYETAIEVALGGSLQHIVTETDDDARRAIEFLKKSKAGRATFLPINTIKPGKRNQLKVKESDGLIGTAVDLLSFDSKYAGILEYLLGRVLIAKDIRHATELARGAENVSRIVTLDGDVVNPGGAMTGGSYQKGNTGLLGRGREIEETSEQLKQLERETVDLQQNLTGKENDLDSVQEQIIQLRLKLQELYLEKTAKEKDLEMVIQERNRLESVQKLTDAEAASLQEEVSNIESTILAQQEVLAALQRKDEETRKNIDRFKETLADLEQERVNLVNEVTGTKVGLAALKQEELNLAQVIDRAMLGIKDIVDQIEKKQKQIDELDTLQAALKDEVASLQAEIRELNELKGTRQELLENMKNERQSIQTELAALEEQVKTSTRSIGQLRDQVHSAEVRKARLEIETESWLTKLSEEFNQTYEEAFLNMTEITNRKEVTSRIRTLKESISSIGNVNIGAIEEFEKVSERYDFLSRQFQDLEQAKESLYKVIEEMEQIMTRKFNKAFNEINTNFGLVFTRLFGGGRAELVLTDTENLLETGIEIHAQPPGKKNQHLSLLSGGEKALTAIALLFAILLTKPSPFCVLDEIEAALDEANVDRFAGYLKEYATNTQFVVITHRKGTMEAADALYGVTMDDSKVTKLVSMKLSEAESKVS